MPDALRIDDLTKIEIYSRWTGFYPPAKVAKLTLTPGEDSFLREETLSELRDEISKSIVIRLLEELNRPPVETLDPVLFNAPPLLIESYFGSRWTNDYPAIHVRLSFQNDRVVQLRSDHQPMGMLPLRVQDTAGQLNIETYQPALSEAVAALMPEGHLGRDRLCIRWEWLREEIDRFERGEGEYAYLKNQELDLFEEDLRDDRPNVTIDELQDRLYRIAAGEEFPEQKEEAERTGKISQRLLKRIPLEDVADVLRRGGDPNVADEHGQTALMEAASPPVDVARFRMLVEAGADVDARRYDGATGLLISCAGGMSEAVAEWVRAGADIHARTSEGNATPLMCGATWLPIVRTLLAHGADVNMVDDDGHTALVYAIEEQSTYNPVESLEAMRLLIEAGVDLALRDHEGLTPLGYARRIHRRLELEEEFFQVGRAASGKSGAQLAEEDERRFQSMEKILREEGKTFDPRDWTPLKLSTAIIDLLISAGGSE